MGSYRAGPAPVERRARLGDQGNNKPSTNRTPGRVDSDSRTKRVEFSWQDRRAGHRRRRVVLDPFLSRRRQGAQTIGKSVICRIGGSQAGALEGFVAGATRRQVWLPKPSFPLERRAPIRDAGEGTGDKRSRNQRRAASPDSPPTRQWSFG